MRVTKSTKLQSHDIEALKRQDETAFEFLVTKESPRIYRALIRMVHDEEEAKNLVQETFLQAFRKIDTFRGEAKISTWLYSIALNLGHASLRKSKRYTQLSEDDIANLQPTFRFGKYDQEVREWNPVESAEHNERHKIVHEGISQLPTDYRDVVQLRDIEELSTQEVAAVLNISEGAVRVRLHRARHALREILNDYIL